MITHSPMIGTPRGTWAPHSWAPAAGSESPSRRTTGRLAECPERIVISKLCRKMAKLGVVSCPPRIWRRCCRGRRWEEAPPTRGGTSSRWLPRCARRRPRTRSPRRCWFYPKGAQMFTYQVRMEHVQYIHVVEHCIILLTHHPILILQGYKSMNQRTNAFTTYCQIVTTQDYIWEILK